MLDEKTIKALLEVAGASSNPDAVDGVLQVQKLMSEHSALTVELDTTKKEAQADHASLKDQLDTATRTMARLMVEQGVGKKPEDEPPVNRDELYRRFNSRAE